MLKSFTIIQLQTMPTIYLIILHLPILLSAAQPAPQTPPPPLDPFTAGFNLNIDCGGAANFTSPFGHQWLSDDYFTGGAGAIVEDPNNFEQPQQTTLRFFSSISFGKKNCYIIQVPVGRYYVRTFTAYGNYDFKQHPPSFDVSVEGTVVYTWRSPWAETAAVSGAYADFFSPVVDGELDICFYSIATDPPVVGSIEIAAVDPMAYSAASTGADVILVNYARLTCGSPSFGPGLTNDSDVFLRLWTSDDGFRDASVAVTVLYADRVNGSNQKPDYFPAKLYETAVTTVNSGDSLNYAVPIDGLLYYIILFHFSEIDTSVTAAGQRVFDVLVDGVNATRIDVFQEVGGFNAFKWNYIAVNLTSSVLSLSLIPVIGNPIISGIEVYGMVNLDLATVSSQVTAMRALRESLGVPDRMGWNGDPCAPTFWDAWEGVTCRRSDDGLSLVVSQLDLGSQGLKGYISDQISLLTNLVSLNLSSNSLEGTLPPDLNQASLVTIDLSSNQLTGTIPASLGSSSLETVLLNNNQLEGQVPDALYSIGLHGGIIDLSGNKGLCGIPTLPACPVFWDKRGISKAGKIAIALASVLLVVVLLIIYLLIIKRDDDDYDFEFPRHLISLAAKRNRYQRTKMSVEMEVLDSSRPPPL